MGDGENLLDAGVRELLIASRETTAHGSGIRYRTESWNDRRMTVLADVADSPEIDAVVVTIWREHGERWRPSRRQDRHSDEHDRYARSCNAKAVTRLLWVIGIATSDLGPHPVFTTQ